MLTITHCH